MNKRFENSKREFYECVKERGYTCLTKYKGSKTHVSMICPNGHSYSCMPGNFKRGYGCPVCAGVAKKSVNERINEAKTVHGEKYDYSCWSNEITVFSNVTVICKICGGEWVTTVDNHVRGKGCPHCYRIKNEINQCHSEALIINNKIDKCISYLSLAEKTHGSKYDYSLIELPFNIKNKQPIVCRKHGLFHQCFYTHSVRSHDCPKCVNEHLRIVHGRNECETLRELTRHNPTYTYEFKEPYINAKSKITVTCDQHGDWVTTVGSIINGKTGCPSCSGHSQTFMYINSVESDVAIKYGIANNVETRLRHQNRKNIFKMNNISVFQFTSYSDCRSCESKLKSTYQPIVSKYDMNDGWTETTEIKNYDEVVSIIKEFGGVKL